MNTRLSSIQIRGVEIGIVVLVLIVWIGAIALFFNRWGKIRMLLPYQPDYKQEQLKVSKRIQLGNEQNQRYSISNFKAQNKRNDSQVKLLCYIDVTYKVLFCWFFKVYKASLQLDVQKRCQIILNSYFHCRFPLTGGRVHISCINAVVKHGVLYLSFHL